MSPPRGARSLLGAVPAIAWAAVILFVSTRPASDLPGTGIPYGDKLLHVAEYAVLALTLLLAMRPLEGRAPLAVLAVGAAFAALDEAVQSTVPGRFSDPLDFAADLAGLLVGLAVAYALWRRGVPAARTFM